MLPPFEGNIIFKYIFEKDLVSIIVVNWNGMKWLRDCIESIYNQTYPKFEIIFVDNASEDGSVAFIGKNFKNVILIENDKNLGFAEGSNIGVKAARGEYVLLLNTDTIIEQNLLEVLVKAFKEIPNLGSVQPKIKLMNSHDRIDECGSYWTSTTFLYHYGYGKPSDLSKYNMKMPFFSNKGACMLIKKEVIKKVGLFDDDFWCYYEETDFCNRLWLAGYECWYYPKSIIYHAGSASSSKFDWEYIQYHNFKNKLCSFIKNFETTNLVKILFSFIVLCLILCIFWISKRKFVLVLALFNAFKWNTFNLGKTLKKRKYIQGLRKKSDKEIFKLVRKSPSLKYYYHLLMGDLENYED